MHESVQIVQERRHRRSSVTCILKVYIKMTRLKLWLCMHVKYVLTPHLKPSSKCICFSVTFSTTRENNFYLPSTVLEIPAPSLFIILCVKLMKPNCLNYVVFKGRSWQSSITTWLKYHIVYVWPLLNFCISVLFLLYTAWFNISLLKCVTSYHILSAETKQINC